MTNLKKITKISLLSFGVFSFASTAATTTVDLGAGTLRSAVEAAAAGDTLVLQHGDYTLSNDDLVIDKSLTIRAINKSATPRIYFSAGGSIPAIVISGENTDFIMQGLYYFEGAHVTNNPRFEVEGDVSSVALLENQFVMIDLEVKKVYDADNNTHVLDDLIMVGNTFSNSETSLYNMGAENTFIFAGNKLNYVQLRTIDYGAEYHIIGNHFIHGYYSYSLAISSQQNGSYTRVLGNLFEQTLHNDYNQTISNIRYSFISLNGSGEFKNNIVKQGINRFNPTGTPDSFQTLTINGGTGSFWDIVNNVFDLEHGALYDDTPTYTGSFDFKSPVSFSNNIVTGMLQSELFTVSGSTTVQLSTFSNNLCFDNVASCPEGNGHVTADPRFVDEVAYQLATGSPAIDAGVDSNIVRDIDGTIADIGVQGGTFPNEQFALQREVGEVKPYLYPLFEANSSLGNTGELKVKAIAIARQR
ncbi:hypothetical protein MK852_24265 [Shewanella benthica]|uniref:hypothetical protein n=1 Tax=Shewanella benthica TaxID=43661 RepID=UPI0018796516|nr:hypothetical protein [Shewanella benthica]MBE7213936.1 hypothetical protein [Shewanella benthica]MCL1065197.1 hypothetical protein [Shewanella benthica]